MTGPRFESSLKAFLFTDVVGSVALKERLGTVVYSKLIARHDSLFRAIVARIPSGRVAQDTGDGFLATFATPSDTVTAALWFQSALAREDWEEGHRLQSRVGVHFGQVAELDGAGAGEQKKMVGMAVDLAARVMSLAGGGQILMTRPAFDEARQFTALTDLQDANGQPASVKWIAHGRYLFKGAPDPMEVFEVGVEGMAPLKQPPDGEKARRSVSAEEEETLGWRPAIGLAIPGRTDWRLERRLGEGGFGEVWLAAHARLNQRRVFKFCFDAERLRSFKREITLFRLLREALGERKDIARLYEVKLDRPPFFLESEYTPGGNLVEWAQAKGGIAHIPLERRLDFLVRVAEAVAAAHSVGVLHKDLKPTNILMYEEDGRMRPRLSDFGIGMLSDRAALQKHAVTEAGFTTITENDSSRTGTRMYAPPELMSGRPFTVQGDVYALGILLYQCVIGDLERPLAGGWERDIADDLLRADIAACVDGDPARRPSTAAEVARRIATLPERRATKERDESAKRRAQRNRRNARLAVGLLCILLLLAGVALFNERRLRLAEMQSHFLTELERNDWSPQRLERLDAMVADLGGEATQTGRDAKKKLAEKFAAGLSALIRGQVLQDQDLKLLDEQLALLGRRDPTAAAELRGAMDQRRRIWREVFELKAPFDQASQKFAGRAAPNAAADRLIPKADAPLLLKGATVAGNVRLEGEFGPLEKDWEELALYVNGQADQPSGYVFSILRRPATQPASPAADLERPLSAGAPALLLSIRRNSQSLREETIPITPRADSVMRIVAEREGDKLRLVINDFSLIFEDIFPLGQNDGAVWVRWPGDAGLVRLRGLRQDIGIKPSEFERADALYAQGRRSEALELYRTSTAHSADPAVAQAARFKEALCLAELNRPAEAEQAWTDLFAQRGERWPFLAGCQLLLIHTRAREFDLVDRLLDKLRSDYPVERLAVLIPERERNLLISYYEVNGSGLAALAYDPDRPEKLERLIRIKKLLGQDWPGLRFSKLMALNQAGRGDEVAEEALRLMQDPAVQEQWPTLTADAFGQYAWVKRAGNPAGARGVLDSLLYDSAWRVRPKLAMLLIERARCDVVLGDWKQAETDVDEFQTRVAGGSFDLKLDPYFQFRGAASLIQGYCRQHRGDIAGATKAWLGAVHRPGDQDLATFDRACASRRGLMYTLIAGAFTDRLSDQDCAAFRQRVRSMESTGATAEAPMPAMSLLQVLHPAILRDMWLTPRGREAARQLVFEELNYRESLLMPMSLVGMEMLRRGVGPTDFSPDDESLAFQTARQVLDAYYSGKISPRQATLMATAWESPLGAYTSWELVSPSLEPALRPRLAYWLGLRYQKLGKSADAKAVFEEALQGAKEDELLLKLAKRRLESINPNGRA